MPDNYEGIIYDQITKFWGYRLTGRHSTGFADKLSAAKAFVTAYVEKNPKHKPLVEGKDWPAIFRLFKIDIEQPPRGG